MKRIGIIGAENSHAEAFTKMINTPDNAAGDPLLNDLRIVGVYGPDPINAGKIACLDKVEFQADRPEDFFGRVDAMMILNRKGSLHAGYAMPFIEQGIPLFIDKPVTSDPKEAQLLLSAAQQKGVPICGGSSLKYSRNLPELKELTGALLREKEYISAVINYPADLHSEYDGFYFYGPHLVEMTLSVFGHKVKTVKAMEQHGVVTALLGYEDFSVNLVFTPGTTDAGCLLFCKGKANIYFPIDTSGTYEAEVTHFARMLHTGEMPQSYEELAKPVYVIDALLRSLSSGSEISIEDYDVG